jgi:hypothetical protein
LENDEQKVQRLRGELSCCQRMGLRNLEILHHLRLTNKKLNEALAAQAVHIEDLEQELDRQMSELRSLCQHIDEPDSEVEKTA